MAESSIPLDIICFPGAPNLPIFVAMEKGYFEDAGIALELSTTPSSAYQAEHLIDGTFGIGGTAFDNVVAYREDQGVFKPETTPDLFAFMGASQVELAFVAAPDVAGFADLRGRKVALDALATGFAFILYEMLDRAGVGRDEVELVPVGATPKRWESVRDGETAGTLTIQPFTSIAKAQGFNALATSTELFDCYQGGVFTASRAWAAANPEAVKGFIGAYLAGLDWALDPANRAEAGAILRKNMPAIGPGVLDTVMDGLLSPRSGLTPRGEILMEGVTTVLELRSRYGADRPLTDPGRYIDLSYYDQVAGT